MSRDELSEFLDGMKEDDPQMTKGELQEAFRDALNDPNSFDDKDDSGHNNPILILKLKSIEQIDNLIEKATILYGKEWGDNLKEFNEQELFEVKQLIESEYAGYVKGVQAGLGVIEKLNNDFKNQFIAVLKDMNVSLENTSFARMFDHDVMDFELDNKCQIMEPKKLKI